MQPPGGSAIGAGELFVAVPDGTFWMGDDRGRADERPRHQVRLRGFLAARAPVTNAEYGLFLTATGTKPPRFYTQSQFAAPRQPVVGVSWDAASAYCAWLSERLGRGCRLPSEAEWEYAARGGLESQPYAWGALPPRYGDASLAEVEQAAPWIVGASPANGFGLYDMGFNVHEWCHDWYSAQHYAETAACDPRGPATGSRRASRGGAWRHRLKVSRCSARSSLCPSFEYNDYGFRIFADL